MLPAIALVASGLQTLVCSSVDRHAQLGRQVVVVEEIGACTICRICVLNSAVLVQAQYLFQQPR